MPGSKLIRLNAASLCGNVETSTHGKASVIMNQNDADKALTRAEIDAMEGSVVIEFGTAWCGFCKAAQPLIDAAMADVSRARHIRIEDGKGRPLGRSFGVKLWPTLIFLSDGKEMARVVRPNETSTISRALGTLTSNGHASPESGDG